jgi:hypothetical protein
MDKAATEKKVKQHLPLILGSGLHGRALAAGQAVEFECPAKDEERGTPGAAKSEEQPEVKAEFKGKTATGVRFALVEKESSATGGRSDPSSPSGRRPEPGQADDPQRGSSLRAASAKGELGQATYNAQDGLVETLTIEAKPESAEGTGASRARPGEPAAALARASHGRLEIRRVEGTQQRSREPFGRQTPGGGE